MCVYTFNRVWLSVTLWTHQEPPSMGFPSKNRKSWVKVNITQAVQSQSGYKSQISKESSTAIQLMMGYVLMKIKVLISQSRLTLCNPMDCGLSGSSVHGIPGKDTGVGNHSLLQGIFSTQGLNPDLSYFRQFFILWATREGYVTILSGKVECSRLKCIENT